MTFIQKKNHRKIPLHLKTTKNFNNFYDALRKRDQNAKSMKQSKQSTKLSFFLVNAISFINLFMSIDAENCAHALVE